MNDCQEYFEMLMVLGECRKHYRNDQDLSAARYPDRQQKSHTAFKGVDLCVTFKKSVFFIAVG